MNSKFKSFIPFIIAGLFACLAILSWSVNLGMYCDGSPYIPLRELTFGLSTRMGYFENPLYYEFNLYAWLAAFAALTLMLYFIHKQTKSKIIDFLNKISIILFSVFLVTLCLNFKTPYFVEGGYPCKDILGTRTIFYCLYFSLKPYEFGILIYSLPVVALLTFVNMIVTFPQFLSKGIETPSQKNPLKDVLDDDIY